MKAIGLKFDEAVPSLRAVGIDEPSGDTAALLTVFSPANLPAIPFQGTYEKNLTSPSTTTYYE